jgi:AbrB family looped-hinge helix DNA binding protein
MASKTYASRVTSKGQITIPLEIRKHLGLRKGDKVEFVAEPSRATVKRATPLENPFTKYIGVLGPVFKNRKEINAWIRDMRDPD